ncbi:MAG TPA: Rrf2 family transcriptional regulator [Kofleriaceae bacterium]|nr:Rrf2 family transcriptional regulator [Kofleriaceae bacterium]
MRFTLHTDYGLRVLLYAAAYPDRVVTTAEIGAAYGISKHHLVRVAQSLRDGGYLALKTGRRGGLALARDPGEISIGAVVRSLEPDLRLVECFDPATSTCPIAPVCGLATTLRDARDAFLAVLDRVSLKQVLRKGNPASHFLPIDRITRRARARRA